MIKQPLNFNWFWHHRKLLLLLVVLLGIFQLMYFLPVQLPWWMALLLIVLILFSWWIGNLRWDFSTRMLAGELIWVVMGSTGFLLFSVMRLWQIELVAALILAVSWLVGYWHQEHIDTGQWPLPAIHWLGLVRLLVLFITSASLMFAVQFYSLGIFWLMLGVAVQVIFSLYLLFWRQGISTKRFWLYAFVLALISEQLVWVTGAWHKNIYFKTFLLLVVYYLYSDFVAHYLKGNLTIKVIFEYIGIAAVLLLTLFFFDMLFVISPNI
ncbi:hypothetical protein JXA59_03115 [Patescibacteria group bacterium]|nr:hypothetical protein [Patescibacteria group bacterium]